VQFKRSQNLRQLSVFVVLTLMAVIVSPARTASPTGERRGRDALDDVVISESFESDQNGSLPTGWTAVDGDGAYCTWFNRLSTWQVFSGLEYPAHGGEKFVMCHFNDDAVPNDDWLVLPVQGLTGAIRLSYWAAAQDPQYPESFEVRVSTGGSLPENFTHLISTISALSDVWTYYEHDLSAFADSSLWIAFHYNAVDRYALKIDDLELVGTPLPTGFIAGYVADDSAHAVAAAQVQLENAVVRTDSAGNFFITGVAPGSRQLQVQHEFFYPYLQNDIQVAVGETTQVNVVLQERPLLFRTYVSNYNPRAINDFTYTSMPISGVIHDTLTIFDLDVSTTIEHTYIGDLDIWVRTPDTVDVQLVAHDVQNSGVNITNCRFDDEAEFSFTHGASPYTGSWRPLQPLSVLDGDSTMALRGNHAYATWYLRIYDASAQDVGRVTRFSLHVAAEMPLAADERPPAHPAAFAFDGCFPNPFNGTTQFRFRLPQPMTVEINLFNMLGQRVEQILARDCEAGEHQVFFSAENLASGLYIAQLKTPFFSEIRKMVLLK
jgi:subtilisin-like proprotein convertase family protein